MRKLVRAGLDADQSRGCLPIVVAWLLQSVSQRLAAFRSDELRAQDFSGAPTARSAMDPYRLASSELLSPPSGLYH